MNKIIEIWGENASWEVDKCVHVHEANYLKLDCSKSRSHLGFSPKFKLQDSIVWTVDWYKAYNQGIDMREMTINQIDQYEKL